MLLQTIVYILETAMRFAALLALLLPLGLAAGCGSGSPTKSLATGQEQKPKEQGAKAAPAD